MNNKKSLMIGTKQKEAIKLDIIRLDKTYSGKNVQPEKHISILV